MWEGTCIAYMSLIFFCLRAVFSMDPCHIFPQCVQVIIPLTDDVIGVVMTAACKWMLSGASSLLCDCHSPVGTRVCSLVVEVEALRSISELQCGVGRTRVLLLGEKPHLPKAGQQDMCSVNSPTTHEHLTRPAAAGPASAVGMLPIGLDVPQVLLLE